MINKGKKPMNSTDIKPGEIYRLRPNFRGPICQMRVIKRDPTAPYRGGSVMASIVRDNGTLKAPETFSGYYFAQRINDVMRDK
jgi:hypothetical protein